MNPRSRGPRAVCPLTVDVALADRRPWAPSAARLAQWATLAAGPHGRAAELAVRVVGRRESRRLNRTWRGQDHATNVLSFPADSQPAAVRPRPLGDLVICAAVVADEARLQGKTLAAHWAHMVVHGVLHLLGYDHELEPAAQRMERRERRLLATLGFPDPYLADTTHEATP